MHFTLRMLQTLLAAPNALRSAVKPAPVLSPAKWDYPAAPGEHFTVGTAKVSIVPGDLHAQKYYLAGYGANKPARGVLNPVYATALWLDDNTGHGGLLLISVDCVGIMHNDVEALRAHLAPLIERTGCRAMHVMSTHVHAGIDTMGFWGKFPRSGRNESYFRLLFGAIESAAEQAYATRRAGDLHYGNVQTQGIQQDKRLPEVFDDYAHRFRFMPHDGGREVHIVNYASHPEVLGSGNKLLSADWVHWLREKVEVEADLVYFNGAIGGMITPTHAPGAGESVESAIVAGVNLAAALQTINNERKLEPRLGAAQQKMYVDMSNWIFGVCALLRILPRRKYYTGHGTLRASMKTEMNILRIGDMNILTIPGEIFPELVLGGYLPANVAGNGCPSQNPQPLRELFNDPNLIIFGIANDEIGYIIPPNDYYLDPKWAYITRTHDHGGRRHYEECVSCGPRTADIICETAQALLHATKL